MTKGITNPKEFIYGVMALQTQTATDVISNIEMTAEHFYVVMNQLSQGQTIGVKTCAKIAKGLDIDPYILYRVVTDFEMTKHLEQNTN